MLLGFSSGVMEYRGLMETRHQCFICTEFVPSPGGLHTVGFISALLTCSVDTSPRASGVILCISSWLQSGDNF